MNAKLKWILLWLLMMPLLVSCSETKEEPIPQMPILWSVENNTDSQNISVEFDGYDVTVHASVASAGELTLKSGYNELVANFLTMDGTLESYSTEWYDMSFERRNYTDSLRPYFRVQDLMHLKFKPSGNTDCADSGFEVRQ